MSASGMPTRRTRFVSSACSVLILVLLLAGCEESSRSGTSVPEPGADPAIQSTEIRLLTGTLERVDEGWTMTSCDQSTSWTILDPIRNLDNALGFASVYAKGSNDAGWTVEHVNYLPFEGFDCQFDWDGVLWRAAGNEPFWMAELTEDGLMIRRPGSEMIGISPVEIAEGPVFMGPGLMLRFADETCADTMVDTMFGWTAELTLGDDTFLGCGFEGMAAQPIRP